MAMDLPRVKLPGEHSLEQRMQFIRSIARIYWQRLLLLDSAWQATSVFPTMDPLHH